MNAKFETIIFVAKRSQLDIAYQLYRNTVLENKNPLILTEFAVKADENKYQTRNLSFYQEFFKIGFCRIRDDAYSLFYSIAKQENSNNRSFSEFTAYKGISLWDISPQYVFDKLIPLLYRINIFDAFFDFEKPKELYLVDNGDNLVNIIKLVAQKRSVNTIINTGNCIHLRYKKDVFKYLMFFKIIKRFILSLIFSLLNLAKGAYLNKNYKVLFFAPTDRFLITMLPVIAKYKKNERLVINLPFSGSSSRLKENKISYFDFYGFKIYNPLDIMKRKILKKIKNALKKWPFESIAYKDIIIGPLLCDIIKRTISEEFFERMREVDIVKKITLNFKPEVVVASDISYSTGIIVKHLSIRLVGIQSLHSEDFILYSPPIADAFIVHGIFWKDFLTKYNVESSKISITGCPRLEALGNDKKSQRQIDVLLKDKEPKKIVVYGTNYSALGQASIKYQNVQRFQGVCDSIRNIKEVYLVVKMHPYDKDLVLYKTIAKKAGLTNYAIKKNIEMLNLLKSCDLLITHISAISYEAVLMDKDVILLSNDNDLRSDDSWDFRSYGAAVTVNRLTELEDYVRKILFDSQIKSELKQNRKSYIFEHAYKMDGFASERAKEVINSFCRNS